MAENLFPVLDLGDGFEFSEPKNTRPPIPESLANDLGAAGAVSIGDIQNFESNSAVIGSEFLLDGDSATLRNVAQQRAVENALLQEQAALAAISDPSADLGGRVEFAQEFKPFDTSNSYATMHLEAKLNGLATWTPVSADDAEIKQARTQEAAEEVEVITAALAENAVYKLIADKDWAQLGRTVADFGASMFSPGETANIYHSLLTVVDPSYQWGNVIGAATTPGEAKLEVQKWLAIGTKSERVDKTRRLLEAIQTTAGYANANDWLKFSTIMEVFSKPLGIMEEGDFDLDRLVLNISGPLDLFMLGGVAKNVVTGVKLGILGKSIHSITSSTPMVGGQILSQALRDPARAAKFGTTPEEIMRWISPTAEGSLNVKAPDAVVDSIILDSLRSKELQEAVTYGINFSEAEKVAMTAVYQSAFATKGSLYTSLSTFAHDSEKIIFNTVYGANPNSGWSSASKAFSEGKRIFGKDADVSVLRVDSNGIPQPITPAQFNQPGEFFFQYKDTRLFDHTLADDIILDKDMLDFSDAAALVPIHNRYMFDTNSQFGKNVRAAINRAHDFRQGLAASLTESADRTFSLLTDKSKYRVSSWLTEGENAGKNFTINDLLTKGASVEETNAYFSSRQIFDVEHGVMNSRMSRFLDSEGYQEFAGTTSNGAAISKMFVRNVTPTDALTDPAQFKKLMTELKDTKKIYDPISGTEIDVSAGNITTLLQQGKSVQRTFNRAGTGAKKYDYVVIDPNSVRGLPREVLNYHPGYVTRYLENRFFIDEVTKGAINGVGNQDIIHTIRGIDSAVEAEDILRNLNTAAAANNTGKVYKLRPARELLEGSAEHFATEMQIRSTVFTGSRSQHVLSGGTVENVMERMQRSIYGVANRAASEETVLTLEKRILDQFKDILPKESGIPKIPRNPDDIKIANFATRTEKQQAKQLKALVQQLNMSRGVFNNDAHRWRDIMFRASDGVFGMAEKSAIFEKLGFKSLAKGLIKAGKTSPIDVSKGLVFNMLLVSNPLRQLALQSLQSTMLIGLSPGYVISGKGFAHTGAMTLALGMSRGDPRAAKLAAAAWRVPESEAKYILDSFRKSGLAEVDQHALVGHNIESIARNLKANGTPPDIIDSILGTVGGTATKGMTFVRKIGFDAGETLNIISTFNVAMDRWRKANKGASLLNNRTAFDQIASDTRSMALSMTKSQSLSYQSGAFALMSQFLSYQHKAALAFLPEAIGGSAVFTGAEKARMFITMAGIYGVEGLGLGRMVDKMMESLEIEVDPSTRDAIAGGLFDWVVSTTVEKLTGEEARIAASANISPIGGILPVTETVIGNALTGNLAGVFLGPSASVGQSFLGIMKFGSMLYDTDKFNTPEGMELFAKKATTLFSGMSNYWNALAAEKMGAWLDKNGNPVVELSRGEILTKKLFGINPRRLEDYYHLSKVIHGQYRPSEFTDKGLEGELSQIVDDWYSFISQSVTKLAAETPADLASLQIAKLEELADSSAAIISVLPPTQGMIVIEMIKDKISREVRTKEDKLMEKVVKLLTRGTLGDNIDRVVTMIGNSGALEGNDLIKLKDEVANIKATDIRVADYFDGERD